MLLRPAKGRALRIRDTQGRTLIVSCLGLITALAGVMTGPAGPARAAVASSQVTVASPGPQTTRAGRAVSLRIHATDAAGWNLRFFAEDLPAGLSISTVTGVISGTPSSPGASSVTVLAVDSVGATGSVSFRWTISQARNGCAAQQRIGNPGFETGLLSPWDGSQGVVVNTSAGVPAHSGDWLAWLGGYTTAHTDSIEQAVSIPASCNNATLTVWLEIASNVPRSQATDTFSVQVLGPDGSVLATLATYTDQSAGPDYERHSFSLARFTGQQVTIRFTGREASGGGHTTSFYADDCTLSVS
jgi:hypothetical protein